ncbi:monooxygenase [Burkholderia cepacia]|uniref:FAD-dependent monooxygenase n=1 Tax=Burkholderia cepacia TaxID=292 RepID=UPI00075F8D05|nr:FAD-dependent monooxygenase [Burkholderia cepacia]KWE18341.1 monooxygenase [Burkholderia cepacia]
MRQNILVVGAGIGGLTAAIALTQRGFDVTVYEQATKLAEVGAGLQLSPNGVAVLAELGLLEELTAIACEPDAKRIRLWNTGQSWPLFDLGKDCVARYGFPYLMVHRGDLHALLLRAMLRLRPGSVITGAKLTDIEAQPNGVSARFEDGRTATGDLMIGADGVHSRVREQIVGPGVATYTGCMAWRGVIPADSLPDHLRITSGVNWVGPGRHVITYPLRAGKLINFVGVVELPDWEGEESWTLRGTHAECAAYFEGWHQDVQTLIANIEVPFRWALLSRPPIDVWHRGRVVLLGDACHPMLPFMAQGAVMAIEDGMILARALEANADDLPRAIALYERLRVPRANRCVSAAEQNRKLFHSDRLAEPQDAERYAESQWDAQKVEERYDWLFSWDPVVADLTVVQ